MSARGRHSAPSRRLRHLTVEQLEVRRLLTGAPAALAPLFHGGRNSPSEVQIGAGMLVPEMAGRGALLNFPVGQGEERLRHGNTSNPRPLQDDFATSALNVPWSPERESVADNQRNDTVATAQHLRNLGTSPGDDFEANILGSLGVTAREISNREDDGAIQLANPTGLQAGKVDSVIARGKFGDGPHGSAGSGAGDFDYYQFSAGAGQLVSVNVESDSLYGRYKAEGPPKDPVAALYDSAGNLLTYNDNLDYFGTVYAVYLGFSDATKGHFDPGFRFQVPSDGVYYLAVFSSFDFQASPFDSASGGGVYTEGDYTVSITLESPEIGSIVGETAEDGAIQYATDTGIQAGADGYVYLEGYIGDGEHGQLAGGTGDFDFFRFDATAGQKISISADTDPRLASVIFFDEEGVIHSFGMDTKVTLYDAAGTFLGFIEDYQNFDGALEFIAFYSGTYYVSVSGYSGGNQFLSPDEYYAKNFLANPFDPASGGVAGVEGFYNLLIKTEVVPEFDRYSFDLQAGDILSVAALGAIGKIDLLDPNGQALQHAYDMRSYFSVDNSPLYVGVGDQAFVRVITEPGRYTLSLTQASFPTDPVLPWQTPASPYNLNIRVARPGPESQPVFTHQVLFLDFDGVTAESLQYNDFFPLNEAQPTVSNLSPLRAYFEEFGFSLDDEDEMIDGILKYTAEALAEDVGGALGRGKNGEFLISDRAGEFQVEILNSRDHQDFYTLYPNVSRIIVGSSHAELNDLAGGGYLGIANHIDVGNYDLNDQSIVIVEQTFLVFDELLEDAIFTIAPTSSRFDVYTAALAKVIVHEAGHNLGASHTNQFDDTPAIMDTLGAGLPAFVRNFLGLGEDLVFGTEDDQKVFFSSDSTLDPLSYPDGSIHDSLNTVAFGLSTGTQAGTYFDFVTGTLYVTGEIDDGRPDRLEVRTIGSEVEVSINRQQVATYSAAEVRLVVLNGSSDRDELDASGYSGPVQIRGKAGHDVLIGGSDGDILLAGPGNDHLLGLGGDDVLVGDDGNDLLEGGSGNDLLFGGFGADDLSGGAGDDLLISGRTSHDAHVAALLALAAEWNSERSYEIRIANLRGLGVGPRANGPFALIAGSTVWDDTPPDRLQGGSGRDWYFARLTSAQKDRIDDLWIDEWVEGLA